MLSTPAGQSGTFYSVWHDPKLDQWKRVKATIDDADYADPEVVKLHLRLYPQRARQDYYCEFMQPAGRMVAPELPDRIVKPGDGQFPFKKR